MDFGKANIFLEKDMLELKHMHSKLCVCGGGGWGLCV